MTNNNQDLLSGNTEIMHNLSMTADVVIYVILCT